MWPDTHSEIENTNSGKCLDLNDSYSIFTICGSLSHLQVISDFLIPTNIESIGNNKQAECNVLVSIESIWYVQVSGSICNNITSLDIRDVTFAATVFDTISLSK